MIANLVVSELDDIIYYGPLFEDIHVITSRHVTSRSHNILPLFLLHPSLLDSTRLDVIHKTKISYRKSWRQSGD